MPVPPGFVRCVVCGEFNGTTQARHLTWDADDTRDPDRPVTVTCRCEGIPCPGCKQNLIHRPITNSYDEDTNSIGHWPYFACLARCDECRAAGE